MRIPPAQRDTAESSRAAHQQALTATGGGRIATEIAAAPPFQIADEAEQQSLAKS